MQMVERNLNEVGMADWSGQIGNRTKWKRNATKHSREFSAVLKILLGMKRGYINAEAKEQSKE
jgi:hypothetical protein